MDWQRIFSGRPDGLGFQEDPGHLCDVYEALETVCCVRSRPDKVDLSAAWFPVGMAIERYDFAGLTKWQSAQLLFEASRFGEASLRTCLESSAEDQDEIGHYFGKVPQHLRSHIFGVEIDEHGATPQRRLFRRAFRLAWLYANLDESVMVQRLLDPESWEEVGPQYEKVSPGTLTPPGPSLEKLFNFKALAYNMDKDVRRLLLDNRRSDRVVTASYCFESLRNVRWLLTALLKASLPKSQQK